MFPIAISPCPLLAAIMEETISGRLVPIAIIVTPTIKDDILNKSAIAMALSTTNELPNIVIEIANIPLNQIYFFSSEIFLFEKLKIFSIKNSVKLFVFSRLLLIKNVLQKMLIFTGVV